METKTTPIISEDLKIFIHNSLRPGRNRIFSTAFWVRGIGKLRTKKLVREALELKLTVCKKCLVTEEAYEVNYETLTWDKINKL